MKMSVIILLFTLPFMAESQKEWGMAISPKIGFLWAHRTVMGHLVQAHAFAGEFTYFLQTKGSKAWHKNYNYPVVGVTAFVGSPGSKEVLGEFYGGYPFIDFPFVKKKRFEFSGKIGAGLAYGTKKFSYDLDPKNVAIGSHFNALICLGLVNKFKFNRHHISLALDMTHFSNTSFTVPNLGLNLPLISFSYGYLIKMNEPSEEKFSFLNFHNWNFGVGGMLSTKEIYPTGGKRKMVFGLSLFSRRFFKPKVGMEVSLDVTSNQAILNYRPEITKKQADILQVGIFTGYILPFDRLHLLLGMGVYLRDKYKQESPLYHKVGVRYYMNEKINLNLVLKSHWGSADYLEMGMAYTFNH
jgi:hypothetical protein